MSYFSSPMADSRTYAFHLRDQALVDEVVVTLVATLPAVLLSQLDAVAFDLVDGASVNAVRADNFHVLFDVGHWMSSVESRNTPGPVMFEAIYPQSRRGYRFLMARRHDQSLLPRPGRWQVWPIEPRQAFISSLTKTDLSAD